VISSLALAKLCGCSQGTVDRALHGRPGIATATRERILRIAAEHGYRPNPAARELMGRASSSLVGAVVDQVGQQAVFFADLLSAVHRRLRQDGLRLLITYAGDAADQAAACEELAARRLRGLLLVHPAPTLALPPHLGLPVVSLVLAHPGVASLLPDEPAQGATVAQHFLALGHRHVAWLGGAKHGVAEARATGFLAAARAGGATATRCSSLDQALALVPRPTALGCHNDPLARQVLATLLSRGLRVPQDCAVMGIDGTGPDDGLSTVCYPLAAVAEAVAATLAGQSPQAIPGGTLRAGRTTSAD
jgi:DNA-binding LacI/PurR family transcriptional regulator